MSSPEIDIHRVATLARLALTDAEAVQFQQQLKGILDYMDTLNAHDLGGVEPTAHAMPVFDVLREDAARPGLTQEQALSNAPKRTADQFQISKVVE